MIKSLDLELKDISKIEGHTDMKIVAKNGYVTECKLEIKEDKRFFTDALIGKRYDEIPNLMGRVCGTCSSAHVLASIEAVEKAFGVKVTRQTRRLRNLLINASHLRDHAMHLWFFILPDLFGVDSVLDFNKSKYKLLQDGLDVKEAGNYLATIIGGRAVHPPAGVIGGFTKFATREEVEDAMKKLGRCRPKILNMIKLLVKKRAGNVFEREGVYYAGLTNKDYNFLEGTIKTSRGDKILEEDFGRHLSRVILPYSTATAFQFDSEEFFSGALARMNLNKDALNENTKRSLGGKYFDMFPSHNIFDNNLAQAIECLHIIDSSLSMLGISMDKEKLAPVKHRKSVGVGVLEAPRGTLYYRLDFNSKGVVEFADLCIPTQQNIISMERTISKYVEMLMKKGHGKIKIVSEIEKMIRAYDPCMSCAAHFLKINWHGLD